MLHRHLAGGHFKEGDQATLACPIGGPVLENGHVHGYPVIPRYLWPAAAAVRESGITNGAHCTHCAVHLSEVRIKCLKSELPHRSIDRDRCYNGCTQSLIVRRCRLPPCLRRKRPKLALDKGAGLAPNVPRHLCAGTGAGARCCQRRGVRCNLPKCRSQLARCRLWWIWTSLFGTVWLCRTESPRRVSCACGLTSSGQPTEASKKT
jgi:hypothetical protein